MNRLVKGSIATAVGVALLLGGASTFASWNSSAVAGSAGTVKAGTLTITDPTPSTAGVWRNGPLANSPVIPAIASFKTVPGDTLTYTKTLVIVATGDNLKAVLSVDPTTIVASSSSTPADVALAALLNTPAATTLSATGTGVTLTSGVYNISTLATNVVVTVTIKFPSGAAGDENGAKAGSVNLSNLTVLLTQN